MNKKIKKVFDKMDPEIQEAVKFLINEIQVKREIKKLEKSEKKPLLSRFFVVRSSRDWDRETIERKNSSSVPD